MDKCVVCGGDNIYGSYNFIKPLNKVGVNEQYRAYLCATCVQHYENPRSPSCARCEHCGNFVLPNELSDLIKNQNNRRCCYNCFNNSVSSRILPAMSSCSPLSLNDNKEKLVISSFSKSKDVVAKSIHILNNLGFEFYYITSRTNNRSFSAIDTKEMTLGRATSIYEILFSLSASFNMFIASSPMTGEENLVLAKMYKSNYKSIAEKMKFPAIEIPVPSDKLPYNSNLNRSTISFDPNLNAILRMIAYRSNPSLYSNNIEYNYEYIKNMGESSPKGLVA